MLERLSSLDSLYLVVHDGRKRGTMRVWDQPDGFCVFMLLVGGLWVISFSEQASEEFLFGNPREAKRGFVFLFLFFFFFSSSSFLCDQGYDLVF